MCNFHILRCSHDFEESPTWYIQLFCTDTANQFPHTTFSSISYLLLITSWVLNFIQLVQNIFAILKFAKYTSLPC